MASYVLRASYPTVQNLGSGLILHVQYCTIQTSPSGVVASIPVDQVDFDGSAAMPVLVNFANAIETVMNNPAVISAVGNQQIDPTGTLADYVTFVVAYQGPGGLQNQVTADADVPVPLLNFTDGQIGEALLAQVDAIITAAYDALRSAAGG